MKPSPEAPLFGNLIASRPARESSATSMTLSALFHLLLIVLAIVLTRQVTVAEDTEDYTSLIPVEKPDPLEPAPPPPMRPPAPAATETPFGHERLALPAFVPPDIPAPVAGPPTDERVFSGIGAEGGNPDGRRDLKVTPEDTEHAPKFTPFTVSPQLLNRAQVARELERIYPPVLRDSGIGGTVLVWILIDEEGRVLRTQVKESSAEEAFDAAALEVAGRMRFSPAINRDMKVKVWIALPVVFTAR